MVQVSRKAITMISAVALMMALMVIASAGMVRYAYADSVETVFVNGTGLKADGDSVEDDNKEGTATLNYDANGDPVLTLDSFNCQINIYQGSAIGYHGNKELTIILKGKSSLTTTDNTRCGIQTDHSLRIKGSGTLSLSCSKNLSSYSGIESGYGDITIDDNCNVTVHSKSKDYGYGLNAPQGSVAVNSGWVTAISANASDTYFGIRAGEHVLIGEDITAVEASGDPAISGTVINKIEGKGWDNDQSQTSDIKISNTGQSLAYKNVIFKAEEYDLWVGGTQVTSANDDDTKDSVIKSGSVSYDNKSRTLTLKDAEISGEGQDLTATIFTKYNDLTVSLEGDNTIQDNTDAILVDNSDADRTLTFTGSGSLTASGTSKGIEARTVIVDGTCSLTASGDSKSIDGKVKNAGPGRGWATEEGTGDAVKIAPSTTAADLSEYKKLIFLRGQGKDNWTFNEFSWTGNAEEGYTAADAVYTYKQDNTITETIGASSITEKAISPTCTAGGGVRYTAVVNASDSLDGSEQSESKDTETTPALGHDWKDATCTVPKTCKRCHVTEGAPLGHEWEFVGFLWKGDSVIGYTGAAASYRCKRDASHYTTVDAAVTTAVTQPTCTERGYTTYTAKVAAEASPDGTQHEGTNYALFREPAGHVWTAATCTEPKTCSVCHMSEGKPLGHDFPEQYDHDSDKHWRACSRCGVHTDEGPHTWDEGVVTTEPTYTSEGVITYTCTTCGVTETETIPMLEVTGTPLAQMKSSGKTSLVVTWTPAQGAEGYDIYFAKNGKKLKKAATVTANKKLKWTKKKLKKSAAYQAYVKAWLMKDGVKTYVKTSPTVYAYTNKGTKKFTNPKSVTAKKTKYTLAAGKTAKIKAKVTKLDKSKKLKKLAANPRYLSSDPTVATVSKSGKITAKAAGTCKIYAYATNGVMETITVKVAN